MIKAIYLFSALVFVVGCGPKSPDRIGFLGGTSHMPLRHERVLRYQEQRGVDQKDYELTMLYTGGHRSKVYALRFKDASFGECELIGNDSMIYFSTTEPLTAMVPRGTSPDWRELWIDENARHGDSWLNEDTGTQTVYAGNETVSIPTGSFSNCYKTVTEAVPELADSLLARRDRGDLSTKEYEHELANSKLVVVRWFAPGVGLVREQVGDDIIRVLQEVSSEGHGLVDTVVTTPVTIPEGQE